MSAFMNPASAEMVPNIFGVEYSDLTLFCKRVLEPLHQERLVEYDTGQRRVRISPRGVAEADRLLEKSSSALSK